MSLAKKCAAYENALLNIMKLAGVCWDGERECSDSQAVARHALEEMNPALMKALDSKKWRNFRVDKKTGKVLYRGKPYCNLLTRSKR